MNTADKKQFVCRMGLPVAAQTQVHAAAQVKTNAAAQQQPAQTATSTEFDAPAGDPVPGNKPGVILCTLLSVNGANRGQPSAGTTSSVIFEGQVYTHTATKVKYSVNSDINFIQFLAL
jgi:hypothetical protein